MVIYIMVAHLNSFCLFAAGEMLPARLYHQGYVPQDTQSGVQTHSTEVSILTATGTPSCSLIPRPHLFHMGSGHVLSSTTKKSLCSYERVLILGAR